MKRLFLSILGLVSAISMLTVVITASASVAQGHQIQRGAIYDPDSVAGYSASPLASASNVYFVGQIGGIVTHVAASDNVAYVGIGPRFVILDVSDSANPVLKGQTQPFPKRIVGIDVTSNYAYVVTGYGGGLGVVDISDLANPIEVSYLEIPGWPTKVDVVGDFAYVANGFFGLRVVDISDPVNPIDLSFYDLPGFATDVAVDGNYAYVTDNNSGLRVIDISDPANPIEVGFNDVLGYAGQVTIDGSYAFVACGVHGLWVVDVSDPTYPIEVGHFATEFSAIDVAVDGNYAYVTDGGWGLRVVDVSNPEAPYEVGFSAGSAGTVAVAGDTAYIASGGDELRVVDVSNGANPVSVGFYDTLGWVNGVAVKSDTAYIASGGNGLQIADVSDPASPTELSFYNMVGSAQNVVIEEDYAYVVTGWGGLWVVDVSNPDSPIGVGFYETPGYAYDVAVYGNFAYVADNDAGLRVVDMSNPANPTEVGFYDTPGYAQGVAVNGGYAYVADSNMGLRVVDVSDATNPTEVGFYDTPGTARDVSISGDHAYVADYNAGLRVVDMSNPANPTEVGFYDTPGEAQGVAVNGSYAYVADSNMGLRVVDVSDPANPAEVGFYANTVQAGNVAVDGDYIYLADEPNGLYILTTEAVIANFKGSPRSGTAPLTVAFANLSWGNISTCTWDFGDGNTGSDCNDFSYTYDAEGVYTVSLTVSGSGYSDTEVMVDYITVYEPANADFSATPTSGIAPLDVDFSNLSTGDYESCEWDFGDGERSDSCLDLSHSYTQPDTYTIKLTVSGLGGSDTKARTNYITVYEPANADFTAVPTSGAAPLDVDFSNLSSGDYDACEWDFGDGETSDNCLDPSHSYTQAGTFSVSLTVYGLGSTDTLTRSDYITVYEPVAAEGNGPPATLMTRNLYLGADLTPIFLAAQSGNFDEVVAAVTTVYLQATASDIPARAAAIADEIAASEPHLVGLQEAVVWTSFANGQPVSTDFTQLILEELAARGYTYEAVVTASGFDLSLPTALGFPVALAVNDVILARTDLPSRHFNLTNVHWDNYFYRIQFTIDTPVGPQSVEIPRQWASVDVTLHGKSFRFITTHLESAAQPIRQAQAAELLQIANASPLPIVLVGDLNAELDDVGDSTWLLTTVGGFADVWNASQNKSPGYTCCQDPSLRQPQSTLDERIDFLLTRGDFSVINAHVVGDGWIADPADPGPPVLWASDHAGIVGKLFLPRGAG